MDQASIGKIIQKILIKKIEKKLKLEVKLPHVNKKPQTRKWTFAQIPFFYFA